MRPPVRMVCGDCLRSVELTPDESGQISKRCPVCDGFIDDEFGIESTAESLVRLALPKTIQHGEETPWTETWEKGNLGTIGRFQIRETLGNGGFGVVYKAIDPRLDRDVALKVLKQANPTERVMERFFREARAAARLKHPNIVAVLDAGKDDQHIWIAYDFIEGRPLTRLIESRAMDIPWSVRVIRDVARALAHAHRTGIYHRDIKPANIMIDESGVAHLIDFGLSRRADLRSGLTREGAILGTPDYMPPEQASGNSHLADERSDIYSLGLILFELLTGQRLSDVPDQVKGAEGEPVEPPSLRSFDKRIPVGLDRICLKALASRKDHRHRNADEFANELERWLERRYDFSIILHPAMNFALGVAGTILLVIGMQLLLGQTFHNPSSTSTEIAEATGPDLKAHIVQSPLKNHQAPYIGSPSKHVVHTADCHHAKLLKNPVPLESLKDAIAKGFVRECGTCTNAEIRKALASHNPVASAP